MSSESPNLTKNQIAIRDWQNKIVSSNIANLDKHFTDFNEFAFKRHLQVLRRANVDQSYKYTLLERSTDTVLSCSRLAIDSIRSISESTYSLADTTLANRLPVLKFLSRNIYDFRDGIVLQIADSQENIPKLSDSHLIFVRLRVFNKTVVKLSKEFFKACEKVITERY